MLINYSYRTFFFLSILICTIGIVVAADVSDFKVPEGYENIGNGSYTNDGENIEIDITSEKDLEDLEDALKKGLYTQSKTNSK